MLKNSPIEVSLRVRPTKKPFDGLNLRPEDKKADIHIAKDSNHGYINNQKENHSFKFDNIFGMEAKQHEIFDNVAKDVIDSVIEGENGTIFAYGQTGSGKTFTMTGGAERYADRGLLPRTISYIFSETMKRTDTLYKIGISYMEIYNNEGYDLLDDNHTTKNLANLAKIVPREREGGGLILSGLSVHKAATEDQAFNLLFIGESKRVVSESPKGEVSTRAHGIFIIQIEGEKRHLNERTVSRLYLVDLSGSGKIDKTEAKGLYATEAKHINLSLHHLEQVIVCLNKQANGEKKIYNPYRNSLITRVLKDSFSGKGKTRLIATISAEKEDIDESVTTCRFAQRIATMKNHSSKKETHDKKELEKAREESGKIDQAHLVESLAADA